MFQIGLAYWLLSAAMPHVPALEASLLLFLETALNPLWAWLVHGENPGPSSLVGGLTILAATGRAHGLGSSRAGAHRPK